MRINNKQINPNLEEKEEKKRRTVQSPVTNTGKYRRADCRWSSRPTRRCQTASTGRTTFSEADEDDDDGCRGGADRNDKFFSDDLRWPGRMARSWPCESDTTKPNSTADVSGLTPEPRESQKPSTTRNYYRSYVKHSSITFNSLLVRLWSNSPSWVLQLRSSVTVRAIVRKLSTSGQ